MLCAPEPVFAQVAHHPLSTHSNNNNDDNDDNDNSNNNINNHFSSASRSIPLLHDPYDPRIEQEYEQLVHHWTQQLLDKSRHLYSNYNNHSNVPKSEKNHNSSARHISASHINNTNSNNSHSRASITSSSSEGLGFTTNVTTNNHLCCTGIIDYYLEEQWRDSQHMLKCAQIWNGRDSLDVGEAVRAMNIISLRLMQRTLETRQMLQNSNNNSVHDYNDHRKQRQQQQPQQQEYNHLFSPWVSPPRPGHHDHIRCNSISNSSIISSSDEDGSVRWRPRHSPSLASLPKVPIVQDAPKGFVANKGTTVPSISLSLSSSPMDENNINKGDQDDDDYEEEQEMYAPLLRRYQTDSSISGGCDGSNNSISSISDWTHDKLKKKPSLQTIEQHAAAAIATSVPFPDNSNNSHCSQRPVRLVPSPSAPSHSSLTNGTCCNNSFIPATNYYRYYPEQHWNDENEEYEYDYSSEGTNNDDGTSNKQQQQEHGQWKSWFHHQHSQHHHYHQEEQQRQQQQPLLLPQSPLSPCVFCYNPVPKKCLSAGDVEETRFFPSSTSGDSSTEDNQSTSYHSAVASDHLMLKEIEEYHNENNNNEASPLLSKSTTLFGSNKHLDEQDQADLDDKYNNLVTNYGILGTTGGSSSSNSGGGIIRSESSISAFRPISKNLAPRCSAALVRDKSITLSTSKQFIYRDSLSSSSSSSSTNPAGVDDQQFNSTKNFPTITKSQSFPSKVAAMSIGSSTLSDSTRRPALPKMASYSTPRPIGGTGSEKRSSTNNNKERNFVMRSIVGKKASLSKLFHAKKY